MNEPRMTQTTAGSLCLFDERGSLIGTVDRPVQHGPLGPGRETVYLARANRETARPVATQRNESSMMYCRTASLSKPAGWSAQFR
jgi:hypothetical protein